MSGPTALRRVGSVVSVETLQRRIGYGGRKGKNARRRILSFSRVHCVDYAECKRFYQAMWARKVMKP